MKPLTEKSYDHLQTRLFEEPDVPITSVGQARNVVGYFFEDVTRVLTHAHPLYLRTGCLCPDLVFERPNKNIWLEVKGCGRGRRVVLYEHKINEYYQFVKNTKNDLFFLWWFHNVATSESKTVSELQSKLSSSIHGMFVVHFWDVWELLSDEKLCPININASNGRRDLTGWAFNWTKIRDCTLPESIMGCCEPVNGLPICPFPIHRSKRVLKAYKTFPW